MIKAALEYLLTLDKTERFTMFGDREFSSKVLHEITPSATPEPKPIAVFTLEGFAELIRQEVDGAAVDFGDGVLIHVVNYDQVSLINRETDEWGRRLALITAKPVQVDSFKFNTYLEQENFIIGVQAHFANSIDRDYVLRIASGLQKQASSLHEDDGISQKVTIKAGIAMVSNEMVKPRVGLSPIRTFPEVFPPASEFVFRIRAVSDQQPPNLGLFEADGGKWKVETINAVRRHLATFALDIPIIA
jgi:hypothetical protein